MRKLLTRLAAEIHHARGVYADHAELMRTQDEFDDLLIKLDVVESTEEQAALADQIGVLYDSQADHLAASRLARATTALPPPSTLRIFAAEWRERASEIRVAVQRTEVKPFRVEVFRGDGSLLAVRHFAVVSDESALNEARDDLRVLADRGAAHASVFTGHFGGELLGTVNR